MISNFIQILIKLIIIAGISIIYLLIAPAQAHNKKEQHDFETTEGRTKASIYFDSLKARSNKMILIKGGEYKGQTLKDYYIDKTLVTVGQYEHCVEAGICPIPSDQGGWSDTYNRKSRVDRDSYAINQVNYFNAKTYCEWVGKRLLTIDEWEWTARGRDEGRKYPWGNSEPKKDSACWARYDEKYDTGPGPCKVGQFLASRDGVYDMAGYQWEWTSSWADKEKTLLFLKGGAWYNDVPEKLQTDFKRTGSPYERTGMSEGFRCGKDAR